MRVSIVLLSAILLSAYSLQKIYEEKIEDVQERLKYFNEKSEEVTRGKIIYKYSNETGVYCEATTDINKKEYAFFIKKDYIVSFFDMFPFKFELKNALIDYHTNGRIETFNNNSVSAVQNQLFSFYLMFLSYNNRTAVFDYVDSINKKYYHISIPREVDEYIKNLPKVIYTVTEFDNTETQLLEFQGYPIIPEYRFEETLSHVVSFIKKNYEKHTHAILPWVNNLEKFRYFLGIIYSRAYSISLERFEILKGYQVTSKPMGHLHKELIKTLTLNLMATSLYPFIDNCNHKLTSTEPGKETLNFNAMTRNGEIDVSIHNPIKNGEEYAYTYSPNMPNEKFVFRYGFFLKNNPNALTYIILSLKKADFSRRKNEICKMMRCFDQPLDEFYNQNQVDTFSLFINIGKYPIAKRIIDALRLNALPESRLDDFEDVIKRLSHNQWLDYNSEIKAFSSFRDSIFETNNKTKFSYEQLIYSSAETQKYFFNNKEVYSNPEMKYKYILRSNIIDLSKESKNVMYYNALNAQNEIKGLLNDQFKKLRNYFS